MTKKIKIKSYDAKMLIQNMISEWRRLKKIVNKEPEKYSFKHDDWRVVRDLWMQIDRFLDQIGIKLKEN